MDLPNRVVKAKRCSSRSMRKWTQRQPASKNAIVAFLQFFPVLNNIRRIIRLICHINNSRIALHMIKPKLNGISEAWVSRILDRPDFRLLILKRCQDRPRIIRAMIIHHNNFKFFILLL